MNVHDSEKLANLLLHAGWRACGDARAADLLLINTCSIREKAEHRLYSDLGVLRAWKAERAGRVLGVGGCVAQQEGDALLAPLPAPRLRLRHPQPAARPARSPTRRARASAPRAVEETRSLERFDLPARHPAFAGTAPAQRLRHRDGGLRPLLQLLHRAAHPRPRDQPPGRARSSRRSATSPARGVARGGPARPDRERVRPPRPPARARATGVVPFAELLGADRGGPRHRAHPLHEPAPDLLRRRAVRAHGELAALCPHVHLPAQSGSDARPRADAPALRGGDDLRRLADALRAARPDVALTTDLIVGFPGETDADFEATLALVRDVGFVDSFSFKYSPRPGTAAAELPDRVDPDVAQDAPRAAPGRSSGSSPWRAHRARVGSRTRGLLEGPSRPGRRPAPGRDPQHRLVHLDAGRAPAAAGPPGRLVPVEIVEATPHSLLGRPLLRAVTLPSGLPTAPARR